MDNYLSEDEQEDKLRRFFVENGKFIVILLIVVFVVLGGWKYWKSHQSASFIQSSDNYEQLITLFNDTNNQEAITKAEDFLRTNKSNYQVLTALKLTQLFIQQKEYDKAEKQLTLVLKNTNDNNLRSLVAFRLARIQLQLKQYDSALTSLSLIKGKMWNGVISNLRGDILLAKGDIQGAKNAFQTGSQLGNESGVDPSLQALLRMKLNNLSS